ncbi:Non-heme chloroperoxidase, partial [Dysosmobacter welbionis]
SVRLQIIPLLHHHILGQNVLAVKEHLQRTLYLLQRPCPLPERRENGDQHIGVVLDVIQIEVVLVVVMGALVAVQIILQLVLHGAVGGLGPQHIRILGGVGAGGDGTHKAVAHGGHRGKAGLERQQQDQAEGSGQQPHRMFFRIRYHLLRQLAGGADGFFRCLAALLRRLPHLFCVLALDLLLLQIPGQSASLLHFRVFLHGLAVVIIRRGLGMPAFRPPDRPGRVLSDLLFDKARAMPQYRLTGQLRAVRSLGAHILMLDLVDFSMDKAVNAASGHTRYTAHW